MTNKTRSHSVLPSAFISLAFALCALLGSLALCAAPDAPAEKSGLARHALVNIAYADDLTAGQMDASSEPTNWPDFRGSETNNAVTQAATPRSSSEAGIIWGRKFSGGYVSPMIIVNDAVTVTHGRTIAKLDKSTGATIAQGSMSDSSLYSLIPPTYADGKIFVTLSNGGLEAFDAKTLKSLWYYRDASGGQGNCPIVYSDGCVYTGYWSGETTSRNFVCLNANTGKLVWSLSNNGGYYWVGAVVVGDYLIFGCDDGKPAETLGTSYLRCVNKKTGEEVSQLKLQGDQRSSIAYDADLGRVYFTTKPGYLYSAQINASNGKLSGLKSLKLDVESTATPLVYGGRVYVGASSGGFATGTLSVVDGSSLKLLRKFDGSTGISGTVKSAPLVSTAYASNSSSGKLYLYFTCNNPPGGITALSISPNSTEASMINLFTPPQSMSQYCICSVICDNSGNLYYKNDSNCLVCIGPGGTNPASYVFPDSDSSPSGGGGSSGGGSSGGSSGGKKSSNNSKSSGNGKSSSSSSSSKAGATTRSGIAASTGNAAGSSATTKTVTSSTKSASASGNSKSSSSKNEQSDDSAKSNKSAAKSASGKASSKTIGSESDRYTDAEAATRHLEETEDDPLPPWTIAAIVFGIALAALAGTALVRFLIARKNEEEPDALPDPDPKPDGNGDFSAQ